MWFQATFYFGLWGPSRTPKRGPQGAHGHNKKKRLLWKVLGLLPKQFLKLHYVVLSNFGLWGALSYP